MHTASASVTAFFAWLAVRTDKGLVRYVEINNFLYGLQLEAIPIFQTILLSYGFLLICLPKQTVFRT